MTKFCVCVELVGAYNILDLETDKMRYDFHFISYVSLLKLEVYVTHRTRKFSLSFFLTLEIYIPCGSSGVTPGLLPLEKVLILPKVHSVGMFVF